MIGAVPEAEVRSAVEHIEINRRIGFKHLIQRFGHFGYVARMMLLAPMIEPAVPKFRYHDRSFGLIAAQLLERFFRP
ncbi:hypothetical protein D3C72_2139770 [compost metagenome]